MSTNVCVIEGRLTRDAEYSVFGQKSTPKLTFSLANNTGFGEYEKTHFFNCEIIGKTADSLAQYMTKGKAVNLTGEVQQQRWEDQDGNKKNKVIIFVRNVSFTSGSKDNNQGSNQGSNQAQNSSQPAQKQAPQGAPPKANPFATALKESEPQGGFSGFGKTDEDEDYIPF